MTAPVEASRASADDTSSDDSRRAERFGAYALDELTRDTTDDLPPLARLLALQSRDAQDNVEALRLAMAAVWTASGGWRPNDRPMTLPSGLVRSVHDELVRLRAELARLPGGTP